jgi:lysophospholipase L1-like esterase
VRFIVYAVLFIGLSSYGQRHLRYEREVDQIIKRYDTLWDSSKETIVFTGSSSIRLWRDLEQRFPEHQIVNTAFGGSHSSDLLMYADRLIVPYHPKIVFIYEGDNDLADRKKISVIVSNMQNIIAKIKENNPEARVVIISAKPSLTRWSKRRKYNQLNEAFRILCEGDSSLQFANVWDVMLVNGKVNPALFLVDGLHMNTLGYDLWYDVLKNYIN